MQLASSHIPGLKALPYDVPNDIVGHSDGVPSLTETIISLEPGTSQCGEVFFSPPTINLTDI